MFLPGAAAPIPRASAPVRTPQYRQTSDRLPPVRPCWRGSRRRHASARPSGTSCRTAHRSETQVLPSLSYVTPFVASERYSELLGFPISCPLLLSTSVLN